MSAATPTQVSILTPRRLGRLALAGALVVAGTAMLILPGPGLVAMAVGLGIAGRELQWQQAARAEEQLLAMYASLRERATRA